MNKRYEKSEALYQRAAKSIPLASQTFSKSVVQYPRGGSPLFLERGKGSRVTDVDGHEYIDLVSGLLPVVLGYADDDVDAAIKEQLERGICFSLPTVLETTLAELLIKHIPCAEMVRFGKNGTDATSAAIRLSRAYTGRSTIIALGYHGWQDWYVGATSRNKGVPSEVSALTKRVNYNDLEELKAAFEKANGDVAAVIMEPMTFDLPHEGYLETVRNLCDEHGALLVFDEVITGFRFSLGGAQKMFGVTPDIAAFGKAMGNGMPVSAVVGRVDVMREMEEVFFSGTFGGEALSLAAAIAVIEKMQREPVIERLWDFGNQLIESMKDLIQQHDLSDVVAVKGLAPWSTLTFANHATATSQAIRTQYVVDMMEKGILTLGSHNVSYAHSDKDLHIILKANDHCFAKMRNALNRGTLESDMTVDVLYPVFQVRK